MVHRRTFGWLPAVALVTVMVTAIPSTKAASPPETPKNAESIGTAHMLPDRTIVLDLVGRDHGIVGYGELRYRPGDPHYADVLEHLHGLTPGEFKPVPAWPDR
jgi:hypothetical protein